MIIIQCVRLESAAQEGSPGAGSAQVSPGQLQTQIPSPDAHQEVKVASATPNTGQSSVHENSKVSIKSVFFPRNILFPKNRKKMEIQNVLAFVIKLETMPHTGKTAVLKGSFSCEGFLKASFQPRKHTF